MPGSTVIQRATGSATITFTAANGGNVYASCAAGNNRETVAGTSFTVTYTVSSHTAGTSTAGYVTVSPITKFDQYYIQPSVHTTTPPHSVPGTFLMREQTTRMQNFAFDGMEDFDYDLEENA